MKLVVFSIDQYSHLGPLFLQYLNDKWPECPYDQVYIAQNRKIKVPHPVVQIRGRAMDFGRRMRTFLRHHYTDDLLLLMMIDYIPKSADHALLIKSAKIASRPNIGHVRLRPMPKPSRVWAADADFGIVDKHRPYSLSLQPGIWDSQLLHDLCRDGDNAWYTETHGSSRTKDFPQLFLTTMKTAIGHHNAYRKQRFDPIPENAPWRIR